jgi:hypothetical protein
MLCNCLPYSILVTQLESLVSTRATRVLKFYSTIIRVVLRSLNQSVYTNREVIYQIIRKVKQKKPYATKNKTDSKKMSVSIGLDNQASDEQVSWVQVINILTLFL